MVARKKKTNGFLIAVEGVTGVGKSYFSENLKKVLLKRHHIVASRIGGFIGTDDAEISEITRFIKSLMATAKRFIGLPWLCETAILLSEQVLNIERFVLPRMNKGETIIYENYNDALIAYQMMRGKSLIIPIDKLITIINTFVEFQHNPFGYPRPDLTIFLTSPVNQIFTRLKSRDGRNVSKQDKALICEIAKNYEIIYENNKNVTRINNHLSIELLRECEKVSDKICKMLIGTRSQKQGL